MRLTFKFSERAAGAKRERVIGALKEHGASAVRPLFPGEVDPELASLFVVECAAEADSQPLLKLLRSFAAVEFAEEEVRRKLAAK